MKENNQIRIVGKGLSEREMEKLLFFVSWRLKKQVAVWSVRQHGC